MRRHHRGGHREEVTYAEGVLRGDRGHHERPEHPESTKGAQVGSEARPAAGVAPGDGEGHLRASGAISAGTAGASWVTPAILRPAQAAGLPRSRAGISEPGAAQAGSRSTPHPVVAGQVRSGGA